MSETLTGSGQVDSSPSPRRGDGDVVGAQPAVGRRRGRAMVWGSMFTVLAIAALGFLGYEGYDAALKVKGGATSKVITDPSAPGYVAAVDASPVHLVALTDADDRLSAFLVFVPDPAGGSGSIIWGLGELVVQVDGVDTALNQLYADQGLDAARRAFETELGFGATDVSIVGPSQLAATAAPLGTVTVENPDPVSVDVKGKRTVKFAAGELDLDPDELGEYLTIRGAGEAPENRSTRAEALLNVLGEQLGGSSGSTSATGSTETTAAATNADAGPDLTTLLGTMGTEAPDFILLPTKRVAFKGSYLYRPDPLAAISKLAGVVRFPVSAYPGQRPRVRILNGTTDREAANAVAPDLAAAGGEILLIGNADSFGVQTTTVVYSNEAFEPVAKQIAKVLDVTAQKSDQVSDSADIDVVLGADHTS